jgi:hypothetical protein
MVKNTTGKAKTMSEQNGTLGISSHPNTAWLVGMKPNLKSTFLLYFNISVSKGKS